MDKRLIYAGKSEKGVFTHLIDAERSYLEKTAAQYHPTIASYINSAKPIRGKTQILLTALGAGEWWGDNANADYFAESELAHAGPEYGYQTFEQWARVYKHHLNKDLNNSYGTVPLSIYNPEFHRCELIILLDNHKAPDIQARIENGDYPDWSMGCKIPYDICNICGNKAPSRKQYCEHAKYYLGQIHPATQKKVFLFNIKPRFFDISYVLLGADRIAKTLLKVAHARPSYYGMSSAALAEKLAERAKRATIEKTIPADDATPPGSQEMLANARALLESIPEVKAREPALPRRTLDELAEMPLHSSLSTMAMLGIAPKPQEFQRLFLISKGLRQLADALDAKNVCFDPMMASDNPDMSAVDIDGKHVNERAVSLLSPHMEDRSYASPFLGRRMILMIKSGAEEQPLPIFIKDAADGGERKPLGILPVMIAAAGAYAAFSRKAPAGSLQGIDKLLQSNAGLGLAAALGIGLLSVFHHTLGPKIKGQLRMDRQENPDANDIFARIEERKQKPYLKLGGVQHLGTAAKRLFLGIPVAYMASGVLQKHRDMNPSDREGRAKSFLRQNPDIVSGGLIADAMLSARGGGTHKMLKDLKSVFKKAAEAADDIMSTDFAKTADAQDFLASAVTWPLAIGNANLPGRIAGGLFDQAVLELSHKFVKSRQKKPQSHT
ncbi:MAG: hypothetical protein MUP21_00065 [Dehalococcoidia bacterium]|nr:hypothetical protein [Dehalococcoidia bacterium]